MALPSMSLEERIEALTVSYQTTTQTNVELAQKLKEVSQQNEYLQRQLGQSLKQKQRILESPTGSTPEEENKEDVESQYSEYELEEEQ